MAAKVKWTLAALSDVDQIAEFIARDSRTYADGMVRRITAATANLSDFPLMGRRVPEKVFKRFRQIIVRPYRIIYKVYPDSVEILAVVHGMRRLKKAVGDRPLP